jgi:hypothetical protein
MLFPSPKQTAVIEIPYVSVRARHRLHLTHFSGGRTKVCDTDNQKTLVDPRAPKHCSQEERRQKLFDTGKLPGKVALSRLITTPLTPLMSGSLFTGQSK